MYFYLFIFTPKLHFFRDQVDRNIFGYIVSFVRKFSFSHRQTGVDVTDGVSVSKRIWQRFFLFFRKIFWRFSQRRRKQKEFPRLVLPSHELSFEYNMRNKNRGIAIIFNHQKYEKDKRMRPGSENDRARLKNVLETLKFDVRVFNDLTLQEISDQLKNGEREKICFVKCYCLNK